MGGGEVYFHSMCGVVLLMQLIIRGFLTKSDISHMKFSLSSLAYHKFRLDWKTLNGGEDLEWRGRP